MTLRIIAVLMCVAAVASADGPLRPGERVVKRFTRDDLAVTVPKSDNAKFTDNASCEPLYDGTTEAAFVVGFLRNSMFGGGDVSKEPGRVHLLTIEHPPLNGDKCVVIGRLNGDAHREGFQGQHGSVDLSQIRLELSAEVDGKAVTAVFKPNVGSDGGNIPQQTFRLELSKSEGAGPTAVSLDLILPPNGRVSFDEIDLVGLGETATAVIPPAAEVPAGLEPTVIWNHLNEDNGLDGSTNRGPYIGPIYFERRNIDGLGEGNVVVVRPSVDGTPRRVMLVVQDAPPIEPGTYGVTGTVNYGGVEPGTDMTGPAWFELSTTYADGTTRVTGTTAEYGSSGKLVGRSGNRPLAVVARSSVRPVRFKLSLVCCGTGRISYLPLTLVHYDPPEAAAVVTPPSPPPWWSMSKVTRPAGFAVLGLMAVTAGLFLVPSVASQSWGLLFVLALIAEAAFGWGMLLVGRGVPAREVIGLLAAPAAWLVPLAARSIRIGKVRKQELRRMLVADAAV